MSQKKRRPVDDHSAQAGRLQESLHETDSAREARNLSKLAQELDRRQAELESLNEELRSKIEVLQEANDYQSDLFKNAPIGYAILDRAGIILRANQTLTDLINEPDGNLEGKPFTYFIVEQDVPIFFSRFRAFFQEPTEKHIIVRIQRPDRTLFYARIEARRHLPAGRKESSSSNPDEELLITISDISDLHEARQQIEQQNLNLLEANQRERRLNAILQSIRTVNQLIAHENNPEQLIMEACQNLTDTLSYYSAWIALIDENQNVQSVAQAGFDASFQPLHQNLIQNKLPRCMQVVLQQNKVHLAINSEQLCSSCPIASDNEEGSCLVCKLEFRNHTYGVFAVSMPALYARNQEEQQLFKELADDLAFALYKIEITCLAQQSHKRLKFFIDAGRQGTWEWNIQTNQTTFNSAWAEMLGYSLEELQPTSFDTWAQLTHPDDLIQTLEALNECIREDLPEYETTFRMEHKDGHWVWILDRGKIMARDENGKPLLMFGTHTDISKQKQVEERLRATSENLQSILDYSPLIISEISRDGRYLAANQPAAAAFGKTTSDLIGKSFFELLPQKIADLFQERIDLVWKNQEPLSIEEVADSPDGVRHYLTTLYPLFNSYGEMRSIGSIVLDITARVHAENTAKRNNSRLAAIVDILQHQAENLQDFLDHALDKAIDITDSKYGYIYFYNEDTRKFTLNTWSAEALSESSSIHGFPPSPELDQAGIWGEAVRQRKPILLNNFQEYHPLKKGYPKGHAELYRYLTIPVLFQDRIVAVVGVANKESDYTDTDTLQLTLLMDTVWKSVENLEQEQAFREREQFLQTILDTAVDGFWVLDANGELSEVNQAYCEISGYSREELHGATINDLDAVETPEITSTRIARILEEGSEIFQTRHRRKDGTTWPVEISATWMEEEGGRFICFCRDLTDRLKQDERITLLSRMLDEAPVSITIHDMEGNFIYANRHTLELHGYSSEKDFMAINLHRLDVPESASLLDERFSHINERGSIRFESGHFHKDGSIIPLEVIAKSIMLDGKPAVLSIASDITERKRSEQALRTSEERFRSYIESSPIGIYISDKNGFITSVNNAACMDTGYSRDELLGMDMLKLILDKELVQKLVEDLISTGSISSELVFQRKDESTGTCSLQAILLPNDEIMGFVTDITDRKNLEQQLLHAQKLETVGRLAGGVAHDFNNMLSVIIGHLELTLDTLDPSEDLYSGLMEAFRSAERSAGLTRQLLAFARKQTVTPVILDLNHTLEGMLSMLKRLIGEDIELVWNPGENLDQVKIDPSQIDQMLANLCVNARDAIEGTGKITINTASRIFDEEFCTEHPDHLPGRYSMLAVSDNGFGMDKEVLDHLFEPFYTTKGVGEGTGLGLAMVYGIVKQNGGFIHVYSEPGQGTTFNIYLPVAAQKSEPAPVEPDTPIKHGTGTILLVEDEPAILQVTTLMLERMGYNVLAASSPAEGLKTASTCGEEIDLVITDVIMPEMNGRELTEQLLQHHPHIKQLFMSGYTADAIAHHGVLDPDVQFIQKPFSSSALAEKIKSILVES